MYLHFEPLGYSHDLQQNYRNGRKEQAPSDTREDWARDAFHKALAKKQPTKTKPHYQLDVEFPHYITDDTDQKLRWEQDFIFQREPKKPKKVVPKTA